MIGVKQALARIAFQRGQLWLVRSDSWPRDRWKITADLYGPEYDWRIKLHGSRAHILARYAAEQGETDRRYNFDRVSRNLKHIRGIVDKVRRSAGP